jgi:F0F1-type ATP synthase membrane subunit a
MMAGHTLLKVIAGFVWSIMSCTGFFSVAHYVPLLLLVVLFGLELGVAVIQSFVFTVLFLIYTHDALVMH